MCLAGTLERIFRKGQNATFFSLQLIEDSKGTFINLKELVYSVSSGGSVWTDASKEDMRTLLVNKQ